MGQIKKVALVHDFLTAYTGAERVLAAISKIYPDAPIYTLLAKKEVCQKYFPGRQIHTSQLQRSIFRSHPQLLVNQMPGAIEEFDLSGYDLVISSSGAFSHGAITNPGTTHICYCHSPIRYLWDWHAEYLIEKGLNNAFSKYFAELFLSKIRIWDQVSAKRVDFWIANSKTVAKRIKKFYKAESLVVYPPVAFPKDIKAGKNEEYFVTLSRLTPNKRIDLLIEACSMSNHRLKVIGEGGDLNRLKDIARKCGAKVDFLGYLSEDKKYQVISSAKAFLFAAEDDFGIAPVEALGCGVPVIAYSKGGTGETIIDRKNGYLFDEPSAISINLAISKFLLGGTEWSKDQIKKDSQKYSEQAFTSNLKKAIEDILHGNN